MVGIAIDLASKVSNCTEEMRIDCVLPFGGMETLGVTKNSGNRAQVLPFTAILDRAGKVEYGPRRGTDQGLIRRGLEIIALMQSFVELAINFL